MPKTRKSHPPSLKAKVAIEAIRAHKTAAQIAQMFGVHPTQVGGWKKQALAGLPDVFGNGREQMRQQSDAEKAEALDTLARKHKVLIVVSAGNNSSVYANTPAEAEAILQNYPRYLFDNESALSDPSRS